MNTMENTGFSRRHIGPGAGETNDMLSTIGVNSLDELIQQTIPDNIRRKGDLHLPAALSEYAYLKHISELGKMNKVFTSCIGMGYSGTITPPAIQRNILENP